MNIAQHTSTTFTYYAFVSYSHKDEKWGKWIQSALERYRLPAAVRKEVGKPLPQRIHPVFRDDTDLGPGRLDDNLRQELEQSRYLIVVCSPNSANPNAEGKHWVNEEVSRFCELGRTDRVIPVIVEGTEKTAFCPKIAEEGLLGLDATKHPKARILNDLVATILGLRPDALWRREERRLRTRRRWRAFFASVATAFVAFCVYAAWDCTRTVTRAFADYVDSYGLPEGIFPLTKEQVSHRHVHYRFEFRGYRCEWFGKSIHADSSALSLLNAFGFRRILRRVVRSNSIGFPVVFCGIPPYSERPQIQSFEYEGGILRRITDGKYAGAKTAPYKKSVQFFSDWREGHVTTTNALLTGEGGYSSGRARLDFNRSHTESRPQANILSHAIVRDEHGRPRFRLFLDANNMPISNSEGISGIEYERDSFGRVTAIWNLDDQLERSNNSTGIAGTIYEYNDDLLTKVLFVSADNENTSGPYGWASEEISYALDSNTNCVTFCFRDSLGNPCPDRDGVSIRVCRFDADGFSLEESNFSSSQTPTSDTNGVWKTTFKTDDCGRIVKELYYGVDTFPVVRADGRAGIICSYDDCWNITNMIRIGIQGEPEPDADGVTIETATFDEFGNATELRFTDRSGNGVRNAKDGVAGFRAEYDFMGNVLCCHYLDESWQNTRHKDGTAGYHITYRKGNRESFRTVNEHDEPENIAANFAYHEHSWITDDNGRVQEESYRLDDGRLAVGEGTPSLFKYAYDDNGRATNVWMLCISGKERLETVHQARIEYDSLGRMIKRTTCDSTGAATNNPQTGVCTISFDYDEKGNQIKCLMFDANEQPVLTQEGIGGWHADYDEHGHRIRLDYLGTNNLVAIHPFKGISTIIDSFDSAGRMTNEFYLGINQEPANRKTAYFASPNLQIGQSTLEYGGFHQIVQEWDSLGRIKSVSHFGLDHEPVVDDAGRHKAIYEYDNRGHRTDVHYFGTNGVPSNTIAGYAHEHFDYDIRGVVTNGYRLTAGNILVTPFSIPVIEASPPTPDASNECFRQGDVLLMLERVYEVLDIPAPWMTVEALCQQMEPFFDWQTRMQSAHAFPWSDNSDYLSPQGMELVLVARHNGRDWTVIASVETTATPIRTKEMSISMADYRAIIEAYIAWLNSVSQEDIAKLYHFDLAETPHCAIPFVADLLPGHAAEKVGVLAGDIIAELNGISMFSNNTDNNLSSLVAEAIGRGNNREKLLVCLRQENGKFTAYEFRLPPSAMGIHIQDKTVATSVVNECQACLKEFKKRRQYRYNEISDFGMPRDSLNPETGSNQVEPTTEY